MLEAGGILCIAQVPMQQRITFWDRALSTVCSGLQTDGSGAETLDGRIKSAKIDRLKLGDIAASRHRVMLKNSRTDATSLIKSVINENCAIEQDCEVELKNV